MLKIGKNIVEVRNSLNIKQKDFAKLLDLHAPALGRYERDEVLPGAESLAKLHTIFNVNLNWLLCGHGDMFVEPEPDHQKAADYFFDQILEHFRTKTASLPFAKKVLRYSLNSKNKFLLALDQILDFAQKEDFSSSRELIEYSKNNIDFLTKASSKSEVDLLLEFIEGLEQEEFDFMCQNASSLKKEIEKSYSTLSKGNLHIDRKLRKL